MKILVVEDDRQTADYVAKGLREASHIVDVASNGLDGYAMAANEAYDVLIVDRRLPGMDGLTLVKSLRDAGVQTLALFLTTMGGIDDRVGGLEAGGDDYLVKPFAFAELGARVGALTRPVRPARSRRDCRSAIWNSICCSAKSRGAGHTLELQPQEFRLLEYLMRNAGRVTTRTMLLEGVWGFHFDPKTSVVETHISRLEQAQQIWQGRSD